MGSGCPHPALRPPPPSSLLCRHAGRPRLDRLLPSCPAVPPCCCPPCFSRSWSLPPSFLAPCCVHLHPCLCLQPPSDTLAAFLVCPGLFASPVPCPGSSLSLLGVCVPVLTQPPLLPGGGGSGLRATPAVATGHPPPARRSLADVNECWTSPGRLCQHTCENTLGSYRCSCASGFLLAADGKRCEGTTGPDLRPRTDAQPPWKAISPGPWPHSFTDPVPTSCMPLPYFCKRTLASAGPALSCHGPSWRAQDPAISDQRGGFLRRPYPRTAAPFRPGWQPSLCPFVGSDPGRDRTAWGSRQGTEVSET